MEQLSTAVSISSPGELTSAANYGDFLVQRSLSFSQQGQRRVPDCFQVNSGTVDFLFSTWTRYTARVMIIDESAAQGWMNGDGCTNCVQRQFSGNFGYSFVNLGVGKYCVAIQNDNNGANEVGYKVTPWYNEGFVGWHYSRQTLSVVKTLEPGAWFAQPFTINPSTRVIMDGGNTGGNVYLIDAAHIGEFTGTNRGASGSFHYLVQSNGSLICSTGSQGDPGAPEHCVGLEQYLPPGNYYIAFLNPASNSIPVSFVAFAEEFVAR